MKRLVSNSKGTSLIQVLVALGVMVILSAGMASLMSNSFRSVASVSQSLAKESLVSDLRLALSSSEVCNSLSFVGQSFPKEELSLEEIKQGAIVIVSRTISDSGLTVVDLRLKKRGPAIFNKVTPSGENLSLIPTALLMNVEKREGVAGPKSMKTIELNFYTYLNASNKIQSCYGGYENSNAQHTCEILLGGTYNPNPGLNKPACTLKPATKDFFKTGVKTTKPFSGTMSFIGGTGKIIPWGAFSEYEMTAPDCPVDSIPTDCSVYMKTEAGQNQVFKTMSFDIDGGDPLVPAGTIPVSWYFGYFDQANLDPQGRPRCTMRIANATAQGAWAEWYPRVTCSAHSKNVFE